MKTTGIVRNTDPLGRIVIPKELRRSLDIKEQDPLEVLVDGDKIILRKYAPGCQNCGETNVDLWGDNVQICVGCILALKDAVNEADEAEALPFT